MDRRVTAARIDFDPDPHRYRVNGAEVPGVTRVLELVDEFECVPPALLERRREEGRLLHAAMALLTRGRLDWHSLDPELHVFVECGQAFLRESGVQVIASEVQVAHPLGFAGTLDVLGMLAPPAIDLFDYKSGLTVPRAVRPQTAAYKEAAEHTLRLKIRRRYAVQLNPALPRGYKLHHLADTADWHIFLSCLNVWRFKNAG